MNLSETTDKMRDYFHGCIKQARGEVMGENGKPLPKSKREIASLAGLCVVLGISKDDLLGMKSGSADEQKFYKEMLLEFELAPNAMLAALMIDNGTSRELMKMFKQESVESDKTVQVIFPNWNAPDEWEDFQDLVAIGKEHGLSFRQMKIVLIKALEGELP